MSDRTHGEKKGASKFRTKIRTQIDIFVFPIYLFDLWYFSNTFHHDSAPARPRPREVRALLLNVRSQKASDGALESIPNCYTLSTKLAI